MNREYSEEELRATWKARAYAYAKANNLRSLYMILRALHRGPRNELLRDSPDPIFPRFGNACRITADGIVKSKWQSAPGEQILEINVGTTVQVEGALRRMCDRLKFTDKDRKAVFEAFANWIEKDERAKSGEE